MTRPLLWPLLAYIGQYPALVFEKLRYYINNSFPNARVVGRYVNQLTGLVPPHKPEHKGMRSRGKAWEIRSGLREVHHILHACIGRELFPVGGAS